MDYTLAMQEIIVFLTVEEVHRVEIFVPFSGFPPFPQIAVLTRDAMLGAMAGCRCWVIYQGAMSGCQQSLLKKQKAVYAIWGPCRPNFDSRRSSQGCSAVYLLFAVWLSMHASVASHSYLADG